MGCGAARVRNEPSEFSSSIVSGGLPPVLQEFRGKKFALCWRASRDGWTAKTFHASCDGVANTLTIIQDKAGNIFGGYTPIKWDSKGGARADETGKGFLFTIKNPGNIGPKKFPLNPDRKDNAIFADPNWGPHFYDLGVSDNANSNAISHSWYFGAAYNNDTGAAGETVFTGAGRFTPKEIEVFEVV
jgi:hypothetical protein